MIHAYLVTWTNMRFQKQNLVAFEVKAEAELECERLCQERKTQIDKLKAQGFPHHGMEEGFYRVEEVEIR